MVRKLMVWTNRDGILVTPWPAASRKRVMVAGGPVTTLNQLQQEALVDLVFREPGAHRNGAVFYDGPAWVKGPDGADPSVELVRLSPQLE